MKKFLFAFSSFFFANILFCQVNTKPNQPQNNSTNNTTANTTNTTANQNIPNNTTQTAAPYLKQKKEEITVEGILQFQFMNAPMGIKFDELKVRYFLTENRAYRARGLVNMFNNNETINDSVGKKQILFKENNI